MVQQVKKLFKLFITPFLEIREWYNSNIRYSGDLVTYEVRKIMTNENDKKLYFDVLDRLRMGERDIKVTFETIGEVIMTQHGTPPMEFFEAYERNENKMS